MMEKTLHDWRGGQASMVESFDATSLLNAPFKVILRNSVKIVTSASGCVIETIVPDPDGLVKAVALLRATHPQKLSGKEIKFLRGCLGLRSKELAKAISVTPEHMSRIESEEKVISPQSEMLVRIYTFVSALPFVVKKDEEAKSFVNEVTKIFGTMSIVSCRPMECQVQLILHRALVDSKFGDDPFDKDGGAWKGPEELAAA